MKLCTLLTTCALSAGWSGTLFFADAQGRESVVWGVDYQESSNEIRELEKGKGKKGGGRRQSNFPYCSLATDACQIAYDVANFGREEPVPFYSPETLLGYNLASQGCSTTQPLCTTTCDTRADDLFIDLTGLADGTEPNSISYGDTLDSDENGELILAEVVETFGDLGVLTKKQQNCVFDYEGRWKGTKFENASRIFYESVNQFAPYVEGSDCDTQLGSVGLFYDKKKQEVQSICNSDSPGKQWNAIATNEKTGLTPIFQKCGYKFAFGNYFNDIIQGIGCYGVLTAGVCQTECATNGNNTEACYCSMEPGSGYHCPMYGPIYYMNQRIVYNVGGTDYVRAMPGARVTCGGGDPDNCNQQCTPGDLCSFSSCAAEYPKKCG